MQKVRLGMRANFTYFSEIIDAIIKKNLSKELNQEFVERISFISELIKRPLACYLYDREREQAMQSLKADVKNTSKKPMNDDNEQFACIDLTEILRYLKTYD